MKSGVPPRSGAAAIGINLDIEEPRRERVPSNIGLNDF
jgi:hypothetical protein